MTHVRPRYAANTPGTRGHRRSVLTRCLRGVLPLLYGRKNESNNAVLLRMVSQLRAVNRLYTPKPNLLIVGHLDRQR